MGLHDKLSGHLTSNAMSIPSVEYHNALCITMRIIIRRCLCSVMAIQIVLTQCGHGHKATSFGWHLLAVLLAS